MQQIIDNFIMQVYLVVYDKNAFQISEKLFSDVKSYIDERMVKPDDRRRRSSVIGSVLSEGAAVGNAKPIPPQKSMRYTDECLSESMAYNAVPEKKSKLKPKKSLEDLLGTNESL